MDARAMEDHDWDECGDAIAALFKGDPLKQHAISDTWWANLDEEQQVLIHEYVCDDKRGPDGLEAVQLFEKYAAEREKKYRERADEDAKTRKAELEKLAAKLKAAVHQNAPILHSKVNTDEVAW